MNESTTPEGFRVITPKANKKREVPNITVTFKLPSGEKVSGKGREGESLLDVVADNNLDIDGFGACEGTLACSTCHLIFSKEDYDKLPKRPADEEMDMLDLAYDLCET
ncbi:Adrenodoxin, mitochondrial [Tyrophagus putrescentiae]|nr:Adrenodoxin, mitochondrial [Tyrophagus putrescentiae]